MSNLEKLAPRERQVMEAVYRCEEASVHDVLASIPDPPTYSTVRAIMNALSKKGLLSFRLEQGKYLYKPVVSKDTTRKSAVKNLVDSLFAGKITDVVATLLDVAEEELDENDYKRLRKMINERGK